MATALANGNGVSSAEQQFRDDGPIRRWRMRNRQTTQLRLASRIGVSLTSLRAYESGTVLPRWDILVKLGKVMKRRPERLLAELSDWRKGKPS